MRYIFGAALALLFLVPEAVLAQRGGRGGNGGWSGNNGWSRGNNWNGGNFWNGGRSWGGGFYGNRGYYPGNSYNGFGYGYGYGTPNYYYETPNITTYESAPRISSYYDGTSDSSSPVRASQAQVIIQVSNPSAVLLIQGQRMTLMGTQRVFVSPDLELGKKYTYTITMKRSASSNDDDTREVEVVAGAILRVDFTRPSSQNIPSPQQK